MPLHPVSRCHAPGQLNRHRSNLVMTELDPVITIGWLLIGIASFAIWCG
jgi:hypothetical protein